MFWLSKRFDLRSHIFFVVGDDGRRDLSVVANYTIYRELKYQFGAFLIFNFAISHRVNRTRNNVSKLLLTLMKRFKFKSTII